jgi:2'-5' RNA ligase
VRLFVGVELSDEMKAAAASAAERLQDALKRAALHVDARWIPTVNLHITLWFIGEVDDARAATISESLATPFRVPPFTVRAAGLGAFPPSGAPRVFWIGVTNGADSLSALHSELGGRLVPLGYEPERRPYSAHLTIARVKDTPRGSWSRIKSVLSESGADAGATTISLVTLFRSCTSPKGATYEPLLRIPLG